VHADCTYSGRTVSPSDAMLLAAVGEVLAFALERAVLNRRLQRITDLVREPGEEIMMRIARARESALGLAIPAGASAPASAAVNGALSPRLSRLSPREREVLRHLAEGASNTSIAIRMGIAETTVKTHVKQVIRKLGVPNRAGATAMYLRPSRGA
jgi:DNA-binding NarL/FixJ family response regulator